MTRAFRRAALPLAAYYFVTLALPFANGAQSVAFTTHALVVLVVPLVAIMLVYAACAAARALLVHAPAARAASRANVTGVRSALAPPPRKLRRQPRRQ